LLHPAAPIAFQRDRSDWPWLNAASLEARVDSAERALGPFAGGERVAWWARLSFDHLALDLAIQRCAALSDPRPLDDLPRGGAVPGEWWVSIGSAEPAAGNRVWFPIAGRAAVPPMGRDPFKAPVGGVAVTLTSGARQIWSAEEHRQRAIELSGGLGESTRRDIVVLHRPLSEPGSRLLCTWALLSGAALLLEPDAAMWLSSAVWARPTILAATREEFEWAVSWLESSPSEKLRRRGGPFGRLRRLVVLDARATALPQAWRRLGVAVEGAQ
jgi:hypothetical protein